MESLNLLGQAGSGKTLDTMTETDVWHGAYNCLLSAKQEDLGGKRVSRQLVFNALG